MPFCPELALIGLWSPNPVATPNYHAKINPSASHLNRKPLMTTSFDRTPTLPLAELELPRFQIFQGASIAYVLRDNQAGLDFPFLTKSAAKGAIKNRANLARQFIGHPIDHDSYGVTGKPVESAA